MLPFTIAHYGGVHRTWMGYSDRREQAVLDVAIRRDGEHGVVVQPHYQMSSRLLHRLSRLLLLVVGKKRIRAGNDLAEAVAMRLT
jgi:hypothetical protein